MHEAYIIHPPAAITVHIESIAAFDNNVILGTRQGALLMYAVTKKSDDRKIEFQLLQFDKGFSKKPIVQIELVPEYQLLFSLSDGIINVNDISSRHNFPLVHSALKTKGATIFALDIKRYVSLTGETAIMVRMCCAVKRKLQLWYWKHDKFLELAPDIDLVDIPRSLLWYENAICIGFRTEYILYDMSNETPKKCDLFPTSSSRTVDPCMTLINNSFAVAKDEYLIAINPKMMSLQDQQPAPVAPQSAASTVDVDNESKKSFKSMAWTHPIQVLVWDEPYALALVKNTLEIRVVNASDSTKDTFIQTIPDLQNARLLVCGKQGLVFVASVSKLWCIEMVEIPKQRQNLLQQKKFHLALQLTNISDESEEEKQEKKKNIQTIYAYDLFVNKQFKEAMKELEKLEVDPCDVIRLFPDLWPQDANKTSTVSTPTTAPESIANLPKLEDRDLENGLLALIDYLVDQRYKFKTIIKMTQIIDTTLLKCYLQTNDSLVASILRLNCCHFEESEKTLKQYEKYGELIILYQTKEQHKKALQLLQAQAEIPNSVLFGYDRTIQYLQQIGNEHEQLIFEFAGWVLEKHPEDGLKIFTEDIDETKNLARAKVLDYLLKNHKSLVIAYLEHIIHIWNETKPMFHDILIQQYREYIDYLRGEIQKGDLAGATEQKQILLDDSRSKLVEFLRKSDKYQPERALKTLPSNDLFEERAIILGKLGLHEKVIAIYVQILGDIDKASEYCEQVYQMDTTNLNIYVLLIRTLLIPPTAPPYSGVELHPRCKEPNIDYVLGLLEKHATKLNAHAVLQILPDSIPLERLKTFLQLALHHQLEIRRKNQVLKGLLYAKNLQAQEQRMHYESKSILVTEFSVCPVCKKKFSNQSAFVRYPDGKIVHYSCQEKE